MKPEILNLIYPKRCPICEQIVTPKDGLIHKKCRIKLVFMKEPQCMRCGKQLEHAEAEYCFDCTNHKFHYQKGFPCMKYDGRMSQSMASFKYKGKTEYAEFYVEELMNMYQEEFQRLELDALLPIPIHKSKYRERGYNQAEVLARAISKRIQVPVDSSYLIRNRKTLPQKELNSVERLKNLEHAFELDQKKERDYKRVMIVDDIYTTGSTIEACARLLEHIGIEEIFYTSVCIGQGY